MGFTAEVTQILRVLEHDAFGAGGRTTTHRIQTLKATGAVHEHGEVWVVSQGQSNVEMRLGSTAQSLTGILLMLETNQPLGVRLNSPSASLLSGVLGLQLAAAISALYVTPPASADATVRVWMCGGGSVQASHPTP